MTKEELKQIYYINKEIRMWQEELAKAEAVSLESPKLDGMPRTQKISKDTEHRALKIAQTREKLEELKEELTVKRHEIMAYIAGVDDSLIRQIIKYRCIDLQRWEEVAKSIGGPNTAESVRKAFERYLEGTHDE